MMNWLYKRLEARIDAQITRRLLAFRKQLLQHDLQNIPAEGPDSSHYKEDCDSESGHPLRRVEPTH